MNQCIKPIQKRKQRDFEQQLLLSLSCESYNYMNNTVTILEKKKLYLSLFYILGAPIIFSLTLEKRRDEKGEICLLSKFVLIKLAPKGILQ